MDLSVAAKKGALFLTDFRGLKIANFFKFSSDRSIDRQKTGVQLRQSDFGVVNRFLNPPFAEAGRR